mmetsp:Transcript_44781/g.108177  ORF Transcript_44781/g.108177 Transcript_44781/m.108177 type:complete len:444 (-) Transcript_44781:1128-2459(-)
MRLRIKSSVSGGQSRPCWRQVAQIIVLTIASALFLVTQIKEIKENDPKWNSVVGKMIEEDELVTVVISRFMQYQPNLLVLGKARLLLFETFCLPTMVHQTNQNFVWLIRTDPQLDDSILLPLQKTLEPYPNFFLVLDNNNTVESFIGYRAHNVDNMSILTGSKTLLRRHIEVSRERWMLEIAVDADDGLHETYIDRLKQWANTDIEKVTAMTNVNATKDKIEHIYCIGKHLLWLSGTASSKVGYDPNQKATTFNTPPGGIMRDEGGKMCYNLGVGYLLSPGLGQRLAIPHHEIHSTVGLCETVRDDLPSTKIASAKQNDETFETTMRCMSYWEPNWHQALRSRAVTSDGMGGFHKGWQEDANGANLRSIMTDAFHVSPEQVVESHAFFRERQIDIMKDNIQGQCSLFEPRGPTCKKEYPTQTLNKYLASLEKQEQELLQAQKR